MTEPAPIGDRWAIDEELDQEFPREIVFDDETPPNGVDDGE